MTVTPEPRVTNAQWPRRKRSPRWVRLRLLVGCAAVVIGWCVVWYLALRGWAS